MSSIVNSCPLKVNRLIQIYAKYIQIIASLLPKAGLVVEKPDSLELSEDGWNWYRNLMYYLSPSSEQQVIDRFIAKAYVDPNCHLGASEICTIT